MKKLLHTARYIILISGFMISALTARSREVQVYFYGDTIKFQLAAAFVIPFNGVVNNENIGFFYEKANSSPYHNVVSEILAYKAKHALDDWLFYQLIRNTSQSIAPKSENYERYTLYKWFLLGKCGYDTELAITDGRLLFYVSSFDNVYDIPMYSKNGKQYICLNYHDYRKIEFSQDSLYSVNLEIPEGTKSFSYKINRIPSSKNFYHTQKRLHFRYRFKSYNYNIAVNDNLQKFFENYPCVDFGSYFNIPLSAETYNSLILPIKKQVGKLPQLEGINYLMNFTRHAFLYETDEVLFGKEKRLPPEQTLFSDYSDCDDRVALLYYLVKEIYNLPIIAVVFQDHVTLAINLKKPVGKGIFYKGKQYSFCDPTPQSENISIGYTAGKYNKKPYNVVFAYDPAAHEK